MAILKSIGCSIFEKHAIGPFVDHRKHTSPLLHKRIMVEISFTYGERYYCISHGACQSLFQESFSRSSIICRSRHGKSQLPKVDESNSVTDTNAMDIAILSNGPGEVVTWVKPTVHALKQYFSKKGSNLRISVLLTPCPHASGGELKLLQSFKEVDRCLGPDHFLQWLFLGHFPKGWEWRKRGVCMCLGGDQLFTFVLGRRLGYRTIVYSEDLVRWPGLADVYALSVCSLVESAHKKAKKRCRVVGDLSRDAVYKSGVGIHSKNSITLVPSLCNLQNPSKPVLIVGILPGSKDIKLCMGVPYFITVAEHIGERLGKNVRFVLPLAPTVSLGKLEHYADPKRNKVISRFEWGSGYLVTQTPNKQSGLIGNLVSKNGLNIEIWQVFPAYNIFKECTLCITTIGTNTAELGYLGVPMVVVFPTHILEVFMVRTGGLMGMFVRLRAMIGDIGVILMDLVNLKSSSFLAWPNRWAQEEIVPELVSRIEPKEVAMKVIDLLESPDALKNMRATLLRVSSEVKQNYEENEAGNKDDPASAISRIIDELMNA